MHNTLAWKYKPIFLRLCPMMLSTLDVTHLTDMDTTTIDTTNQLPGAE